MQVVDYTGSRAIERGRLNQLKSSDVELLLPVVTNEEIGYIGLSVDMMSTVAEVGESNCRVVTSQSLYFRWRLV